MKKYDEEENIYGLKRDFETLEFKIRFCQNKEFLRGFKSGKRISHELNDYFD